MNPAMAQTFSGYQRILLPVDFSDYCTAAAQHAAWLAKQSGGTVHVAHVIENPLDPIYEPEAVEHWVVVEHADKKAHELLEATAASCLPAECARVLHVLSGDPYPKLLELSATIGCDLIVMGGHGTESMVHLLLGTVADKIARHATCPVMIVRLAPDR
jgi:nucleotide-binding universal stress UspA family protein